MNGMQEIRAFILLLAVRDDALDLDTVERHGAVPGVLHHDFRRVAIPSQGLERARLLVGRLRGGNRRHDGEQGEQRQQ